MKFYIIPAAVMMLGTSAMAETMSISFCTGKANDPYNIAGHMIGDMAANSEVIQINVVADTGGTWANVKRTAQLPLDHEKFCHAMIGQPDGPTELKRKSPSDAKKLREVQSLHPEYLHVACGKDSDVDELEDLESDPKGNSYKLALGQDGSGAWLIWQSIIVEDDDYAAVPTTPESGALAIAGVASGDITCMLVPAGLRNETMIAIDNNYGDRVVLAEAQDKDFNDAEDFKGDPLYKFDTIPGKTYPANLQSGMFSGVDTISWDAKVYVNTEAFKGRDKELAEFVDATSRARAAIIAEFQ